MKVSSRAPTSWANSPLTQLHPTVDPDKGLNDIITSSLLRERLHFMLYLVEQRYKPWPMSLENMSLKLELTYEEA